MRTTDPLAAITALLESSEPDTVIQYDGITYRVAPSESKREGFYEILTQKQAKYWMDRRCPIVAGEFRNATPEQDLAEWMASNAETWLRSARYNESLATTTSDD